MPIQAFCRPKVQASLAFLLAAQWFLPVYAPAQQSPPLPAVPATPWQPQIHFNAAPNWINDPNGPIVLDGKYHLFYQYNPFGDQWGHMSWGHAVSPDLVHWKQLPVAIAEEKGIMIFSGSTVEDGNNTSGLCGEAGKKTPGCVIAVYTGASEDKQNQNLAVSRDGGTTFTKFSGNPVIDPGLKDFRDPKVSVPDQHKVRFYRSKNLRQWEMGGEFGPAGAVSGVWECPDLFELPVRQIAGKHDAKGKSVDRRWVLSVNLNPGGPQGGSADQYFVGRFDGSQFTEDHPGSGPHWADWGKDFYASTSFSNTAPGQDRLWIAWMNNWQYAGKGPSLPGRGELTTARSIWLSEPEPHANLSDVQEPLLLVQRPIVPTPAYKPSEALFGGAPYETIDQANAKIAAQKVSGSVYVLRVTLDPGDSAEAGIRLRRSSNDPSQPATEETVVGIDRAKGRIFVDRSHSGSVDWSSDFSGRTYAPLKYPQDNSIRLEIVVDRNSIEVFAEDGKTVLTNLVYPSPGSQGIGFYSTPTPPGSGPALVRGVEFIPLQ